MYIFPIHTWSSIIMANSTRSHIKFLEYTATKYSLKALVTVNVMYSLKTIAHSIKGDRDIQTASAGMATSLFNFVSEEAQIGALLTMRDAESVRRIEDEIELSRRISASGRVTRGVAHEVKNPINAIVLHLQLLRNKLQDVDPATSRHVDIIDSEIHRLDRVVQILVDFTRPRDLHLEETDLRSVLEEVALLAAPDAEQHGVNLVREFPRPDPGQN